MVEWETDEITAEPLNIVATADPITCVIYARYNNLLEETVWQRFKSIANQQKKLLPMVNQAKLRSFCTAPKYKYGYEVPRGYKHALSLDKSIGTTNW